jgi:hypothetical protein
MRVMAPADWSRLRHPDEDRSVSALSMLVAPLLAVSSAVPLDGRTRPGAPLSGDGAPRMTEAVRWAARTLDVLVPELFTRNDQMAPVRFVNGHVGRTLRSALVIGLPLLGDRRRLGELLPPLTLQMALLRPERMLRLLVADAEVLTMLLRATVSVACDEPATPELAVTMAALKHSLTPLASDQLRTIGRRLRDQGRELGRVAVEWLRGAGVVERSAAHARGRRGLRLRSGGAAPRARRAGVGQRHRRGVGHARAARRRRARSDARQARASVSSHGDGAAAAPA